MSQSRSECRCHPVWSRMVSPFTQSEINTALNDITIINILNLRISSKWGYECRFLGGKDGQYAPPQPPCYNHQSLFW